MHRTASLTTLFTLLAFGFACGGTYDPEGAGEIADDPLNAVCYASTGESFIDTRSTPAPGAQCQTMQQTCAVINGITVCNNVYTPGQYVCWNFANDFDGAAGRCGIPSWVYAYWCWGGSVGHQINIVQVTNPNGGSNPKFCLVEPQTNAVIDCWIQAPGTPNVPSFLEDKLCDHIKPSPYYYDSPDFSDQVSKDPIVWTTH